MFKKVKSISAIVFKNSKLFLKSKGQLKKKYVFLVKIRYKNIIKITITNNALKNWKAFKEHIIIGFVCHQSNDYDVIVESALL